MSDPSAPAVTALILNWNNYEDTVDCLNSLNTLSYENLNLLVIDNGSTDGSAEQINKEFPNIEMITHQENRGFAGGLNPGITEALDSGAEYVWIINNDTTYPDSNILSRLVETITSDSDVGIVSPLIRKYPATTENWFQRGFIDDRSRAAGHQTGSRSLTDLRFDKTPVSSYRDGHLIENDFVPLCCALISRETIEQAGPLCEDYFLYYEDVDYCRRATQTGYRVLTDTRTEAYHRVKGSSDGDATATYYEIRNRIIFAQRHSSIGVMFWLFIFWYLWLYWGYYTVNRDWGLLKALFQGVVHGIQEKSGRGPYP
jgi:GT2 family glycosyltransferase